MSWSLGPNFQKLVQPFHLLHERENVLLCTMCGENFIPVIPAETMCANCVVKRKNLCRKQQLQISHRMLLRTRVGLREKGRGVSVPLFPKGEGSVSSSPIVKRRDMVDDQMGNPKEALRYT
jgi:hypothetical protein